MIPTGEGAQGLLEAAVISALAESIVPAAKSGMGHFHRFSHFGAPKRGAIPHANSVKLRGPRWRSDRRHTLSLGSWVAVRFALSLPAVKPSQLFPLSSAAINSGRTTQRRVRQAQSRAWYCQAAIDAMCRKGGRTECDIAARRQLTVGVIPVFAALPTRPAICNPASAPATTELCRC